MTVDDESDACDCAACREGLPPPVYRPSNVNGEDFGRARSTLEILADHWPSEPDPIDREAVARFNGYW